MVEALSKGVICRTERLILRQADPKDADAVHSVLASDFDVVGSTGTWPWPPDREFTTSRCHPFVPEFGLGGVVSNGDNIVGMASVVRDGELGYMFARDTWGRGYATEICKPLIDAAFASGKWGSLHACVFTDNPGSARVLEKLGFTEGANCVGTCVSRAKTLPTRNFSLVAPRG